jgi:hypothetical protein
MSQDVQDWRRQAAEEAADADAAGKGNYFTDGEYRSLIVDKLKLHSGAEGVSFIMETLVEKAASVNEIDTHGQSVSCSPVGSRASVAYNKTKHKAALPNIKMVAMAIAGVTEHDIARDQAAENARAQAANERPRKLFAEWILKATNEDPARGKVNPYRGVRISGSSYRQKRKVQPEGTPRKDWPTYMQFRNIPGQTTEMVLDGRQKLEQGIADVPVAGPPVPVQASPQPAPPPAPQPPAAQAPQPPAAPSAPPPSGLGGSMLDDILP